MRVFKHHLNLSNHIKKEKPSHLGLVPTMGALHKGHLTLVEKSLQDNALTIVSIFVNPTQFDDLKDLKAYPKTLAQDLDKLAPLGDRVMVYAPDVNDLYPSSAKADHYELGFLEATMEGASREGHFQGVATIVHRLLEKIKPTHAYFGEKDYQQLRIIHRLVQQKNLPIKIVDCPIVREVDGLAMSSRNVRLTAEERQVAPLIYKTLSQLKQLKNTQSISEINVWVNQIFNEHPLLDLDYFCIVDGQNLSPVEQINDSQKLRAFIAVKLGSVRLIDNVNF